jgi:hydrogenase expression/formation protein HypC
MCLAVPGKIEKIDNSSSPKMAKVSFGGLYRDVCIDFMPDIKTGEYVVVHAGYALERINQKEAEEQLRVFMKAEDLLRDRRK